MSTANTRLAGSLADSIDLAGGIESCDQFGQNRAMHSVRPTASYLLVFCVTNVLDLARRCPRSKGYRIGNSQPSFAFLRLQPPLPSCAYSQKIHLVLFRTTRPSRPTSPILSELPPSRFLCGDEVLLHPSGLPRARPRECPPAHPLEHDDVGPGLHVPPHTDHHSDNGVRDDVHDGGPVHRRRYVFSSSFSLSAHLPQKFLSRGHGILNQVFSSLFPVEAEMVA